MCGIVAVAGDLFAVPVLLEGLKKLEYRGYDSSGLAFLQGDQVIVEKKQGRIVHLEQALFDSGWLDEAMHPVRLGIGHTRWATHGVPSDENAHPHLSSDSRFAVVHNGIIENESELRYFLQKQGFTFRSQTDSEVIAHLIEFYYGKGCTRRDWFDAVQVAMNDLTGSYALAVIAADHPKQLLVARKESPLIIGVGDHWHMAASDIPAVLNQTNRIIILEDGDMACISADSCQIYDVLGQSVSREITLIEWDCQAAEKDGYEHFMIKEIHEEPQAVRQTLSPRIVNGEIILKELQPALPKLAAIESIYLVACGTAYHAGVVGQKLIEHCCRRRAQADLASEFRYSDPLVDDKTLVIVISQSGETLDTLAALRLAKSRGAMVLAIVNVAGSSIAREADYVIHTHAGPEISVASTKAYSTQLAALSLLTLYLADLWKVIDRKTLRIYLDALSQLPEKISAALTAKDQIQRFASEHFNARSVFFMGRYLDYALAMESSLKLKEISYIHSEAYAGGELKHGTIALIEEGTLVICIMTQPHLVDKMISNIREVKTRGAVVLGMLTPACQKANAVCDEVIMLPDIHSLFAPAVAVTPAQMLAYYFSLQKGHDVDKPRNLAKSVTVE